MSMWHREAITDAIERTLQELNRSSVLENFYLAGGTGLALHLGHRRSIDLDFFSSVPFDPETILGQVEKLKGLHVLAKDLETLHLTLEETKVSFLGYRYPVLFPFHSFQGVNIADPREIACMKVNAIAGRGTKRDFIDLYTVSRHHELEQILAWFKKKFAQTNYSMIHVLKSLTFFQEAEQDPMPDMLVTLNWQRVTDFFSTEVPRLL